MNFEQLEGETFSSQEAARIVSLFSSAPVDDFLLDSGESFHANSSYIINDDVSNEPIARLHISLDPAVLAADPSGKAFRFQLTARGGVQGSDSTVMMSKADIGHEWIVRSFASLTTPLMHERWGRTQ